MNKLILKIKKEPGSSISVSDFIAEKSGLSKTKIKDAMNKGALWIRKQGRMKRLRKATAELNAGDYIEFHYDEKLLSIKPAEARLLSDRQNYSVWFKPAGMLAQGTMYGDHCSLMRQVETSLVPLRKVFLVHRVDREASGVMIIAHSKEAAARLSELFQKNMIIKKYRVEVLGNPGRITRKGTITFQLDGKPSITEYEVESYDEASNIATINVIIKTGRLHQIRRHFDMAGFPIIGDPKYGKGNKNKEGMKLVAVSLSFLCPFAKREVKFII